MLSELQLPKLPEGYRWKLYKRMGGGSDVLAIQKKRLGFWCDQEISFPCVYSYGSTVEESIQSAARTAFGRFDSDISRYYGTNP